MKQILIIVMTFALFGCTKSYDEVSSLEAKCKELGGTVAYFKGAMAPRVLSVSCIINDNMYAEGKY